MYFYKSSSYLQDAKLDMYQSTLFGFSTAIAIYCTVTGKGSEFSVFKDSPKAYKTANLIASIYGAGCTVYNAKEAWDNYQMYQIALAEEAEDQVATKLSHLI